MRELEQLAERQTQRANEARERNRERFPTLYAEFIEPMQREFGCEQVKVLYVREGESSAGKLDARPWIPWPSFGRYGDPRQMVADDSVVRKRR